MWQYGHIIIDVVCHMTNSSAGNRVYPHCNVVLEHADHTITKDEDFRRDDGVVAVTIAVVVVVTTVAFRLPSRALTVVVLLLALTALKWLPPIDKFIPVLVAVVAGPCMPAWDVVGAKLDMRLPNAVVQTLGVAKFQFDRWFDDGSAVLDEKVVKEAVADHRHFSFT